MGFEGGLSIGFGDLPGQAAEMLNTAPYLSKTLVIGIAGLHVQQDQLCEREDGLQPLVDFMTDAACPLRAVLDPLWVPDAVPQFGRRFC